MRLSDFCCQGGPPPRPQPAGRWKRRGGGSGQGQAGPQVPLPSCPASLPGFGGSISPGSIPHHIPEPAHRTWHVWAPQSPGLTSPASLPGAGPAWPVCPRRGHRGWEASVMGRPAGHVYFMAFATCLHGQTEASGANGLPPRPDRGGWAGKEGHGGRGREGRRGGLGGPDGAGWLFQ